MRFYGVPTVIILIGGIIFKIIFYKYGNYFLDEIYYYYFLGARKDYLISSFVILVIVFVVFYLIKYFQNIPKVKEIS